MSGIDDALLDQHGHGAEQLRGEEREGEIARVGHHAHVERLGHAACDSPGAAHRLDDAVHQKTRARRIGMREHQVEALVGREVMVDQHAAGRGVGRDGVAEDFEPRNGVEIEAEDHVGLRRWRARARPSVSVLKITDLVDPGHPVEEIGVFVRARRRSPHVPSYAGPRPMPATIRRRRRRGWCGRRSTMLLPGSGRAVSRRRSICSFDNFIRVGPHWWTRQR